MNEETIVTTATNVVGEVTHQVASSVTGQVAQSREFLDRALDWLASNGVEYAINVLGALLILLLGGLVLKLLKGLLRKTLRKAAKQNPIFENFLVSVVSKCGWAVLVVLALGRLGVDVGPLVAGLGVTGFILGFAFQESLSNLAAGMMIALNRPFDVGDYVTAGGQEGSVSALDMIATVLTTADNRKIVLPNRVVWGAPIVNFTAQGRRRCEFQIGIAYGESVERAKEIALKAVATIPEALGDPAPTAGIAAFSDSAVTIWVRAWAKSEDYFTVLGGAQERVKEAFDKAGVAIPFPQVDVHLVK